MLLNTIKPAPGSKHHSKRLGRGGGSGKGKTCGRGHKGQRARAGGYHKVGFEGGQMPIQRRLPKFGFFSRKAQQVQTIRLSDLARLKQEMIDLKVLRKLGVIGPHIKKVKVIKHGDLKKAITLKGLSITAGAKMLIEQAGGKVEI